MQELIGALGPADNDGSVRELKDLKSLPPAVRNGLEKAHRTIEDSTFPNPDDSESSYHFDAYYEVRDGKNGPVLGYAALGSNGDDPEDIEGIIVGVSPTGKELYTDTDSNAD